MRTGGGEFCEDENSYTGERSMTKDPVCGMQVDENKAQHKTQYGGKQYNFCSADCKRKFEEKPEQYARSASAA